MSQLCVLDEQPVNLIINLRFEGELGGNWKKPGLHRDRIPCASPGCFFPPSLSCVHLQERHTVP